MSDEQPDTLSRQECRLDCPSLNWVFRLLVCAQFVTAGSHVALRSPFRQFPTTLMALVGILIGVWAILTMGASLNASPKLKENASLKTHGPYRFVRHPMYLALTLFCGSFALADMSYHGGVLFAALTAILCMKIYYEEKMLRDRFPEYHEYSQATRRLIPFLF